MYIVLVITCMFLFTSAGDQLPVETHLAGVYQGKSLFIQNPFHPGQQAFCIQEVYVNNLKVGINSRMSAIKLDFDGMDLNTPVSIRIIQKDSCELIIINPDAIHFHSAFSFLDLVLTDSALVWNTFGEKNGAQYLVEKYQSGIWIEEAVKESTGVFEGAKYTYFPKLEVGANKYRIKYLYPSGKHLYSPELDFHFYPEPVTFFPKRATEKLTLSRPADFQIYDMEGELVLTGRGVTVDVKPLRLGDYVIYFDGENPTIFTRDK